MTPPSSTPPKAQLASLVSDAPDGDDWLHEIKYDGYRILAVAAAKRPARLWTRNGKDWSDRFSAIAAEVSALGRQAVLDGEVVVLDGTGRTSFQALQNHLGSGGGRGQLVYFVFDVLELDGRDVRRLPLVERKALLAELLGGAGLVRYSDHALGGGPGFFEAACGHQLEGIICKRASAPYRPGRGSDWVKVKCMREQEFVIGGFTDPSGSRTGFGALLVGAWADGRLIYHGKVGTGFNDATLRTLHARLKRLGAKASPFDPAPRGADVRGAHWVQPELVAQVRYTEMTDDGRLRHPSFQGLREDKPATAVTLEAPAATGKKSSVGKKNVAKKSVARKSVARKSVAKKSVAKKAVGTPPKSGRGAATEVAGVRLTSPDKVLYPGQGVTKLELARYYEAVAPWMIPHISGRPLTLVRCPAGHERECFFQKHLNDHIPDGIRRVRVTERDGPEWYGVLDGVEGLVGLVQMGVLELHTWNSREDRLERPDRFIIDLDPDEGLAWEQVIEAALDVRTVLEELGLVSFLKTSGGKGVHVVVPLVRRAEWDEVRDFSRAVCSLLAGAAPDRYTLDVAKRKRRGRILLDYLRNTRGATAVEVYSSRARAGAPVSAPITWAELEAGVRADAFTVRNLPERLASQADPWKEFGAVKQSLTAPMKRRLGLG